MEKPWYILEYEEKEYLHEKELQLKDFPQTLKDHRHCELCWNRFSNSKEDLHFGYYDSISKSWICETCYIDFKELFKWTIK